MKQRRNDVGHEGAGYTTLSFDHRLLAKASTEPVQKERISLKLLKAYEELEGKEQHHSHTTDSLLMPIYNPSRQLL